jgi:hypothetical protein
MKTVFEWTALATWAVILGASLMYGTLSAINVIYRPEIRAIDKIQDRFPHRVAYGIN